MHDIVKNMDLYSKGVWLPLTLSSLLFLYALFMRKKGLSWKEFYVTMGCIGYMAWIGDTLTGNMINLYDLGKPNVTGLGDTMAFALIPASLSCIFLNYRTEANKWPLSALFVGISMTVYWFCMAVGYFKQHGWNWLYSLVFFIFAFTILVPLHARIMRSQSRVG